MNRLPAVFWKNKAPRRQVSPEAQASFDAILGVIERNAKDRKWKTAIWWDSEAVAKSAKLLPPPILAEVLRLLLDEILPIAKLLAENAAKDPHAYYSDPANTPTWSRKGHLQSALRELESPQVPFTPEMNLSILEWMTLIRHVPSQFSDPFTRCLKSAKELLADPAHSEMAREKIMTIFAYMQQFTTRDVRAFMTKLSQLVGGGHRIPITKGEVWANAVLEDLGAMDEDRLAAWRELLLHASSATGSKPTTKWADAFPAILEATGADEFKTRLLRWFPLVDKPRTLSEGTHPYQQEGSMHLSDEHMDVLRGLVWGVALAPFDKELARALTSLALSSYKKIPGLGPRATRVGNACIGSLARMRSLDAVGQLALLKIKVKFGSAQKEIDKALEACATALNLPREELEEMAVPGYGLDSVGAMSVPLGHFTAELRIIDTHTVDLAWRKADGRIQKSLPAAVKSDFVEELKELKLAKTDILKMLPAQAQRIDGLFLRRQPWAFETWAERYLNHPLIGTLARRLIWNFETDGLVTPGVWLNGKLLDRTGHPVLLSAATLVRLWHPLHQSSDTVLGWRGWLEEWGIRQPFKQAHREIYLLTPAEEQTRVYSNRFAAHVIKQHQFNALCAARGWKNRLRLMVDDEYPPAARHLPEWDLRAEFWIEGAGDSYGEDTTDSGTFLHLATDQVRFYREGTAQVRSHASGGGYGPAWNQGTAEPLPLAEIPPLVLSEVMRDVDLFIGVCSVGNDPAWADGGRSENHAAYWREYSFGALSTAAESRKALLEHLVPKLKIAPLCSFEDKFLKVKGKRHTYKIHIGSGNILRSPDNRYLCIVPGSAAHKGEGKVFLPFEGDRTLSVILSKALLLAGDDKISDRTILQQL